MRTVALLLIAVALSAATANAACHNITGTCFPHGFECANSEVVAHSKRCNGVEDCADGTDEFMCSHDDPTPLHERSPAARHAVQQASCVKCTCPVATQAIASTSGWFKFAIIMPTDFLGLMTGGATGYKGTACSPTCTTSVFIAFYKKYKVCRGWLCCARQRECLTCSSVAGCTPTHSTANHCWS